MSSVPPSGKDSFLNALLRAEVTGVAKLPPFTPPTDLNYQQRRAQALYARTLESFREEIARAEASGDGDLKFSLLSQDLFNRGEVEWALKLIRNIESEALRSMGLQYCSQGFSERDELDRALLVAREIARPFERDHSLITLACKLRKDEKLDEALAVVEEISRNPANLSHHGPSVRDVLLCDIAFDFLVRGEFQRAREIEERIDCPGEKTRLLSRIAEKASRE